MTNKDDKIHNKAVLKKQKVKKERDNKANKISKWTNGHEI